MRSIWKGHIQFLMVSIPVRIYNAIETSERIHFNQLHNTDSGPVGYDKRCKKCNQVLSAGEIVKGYQFAPEQWVIVEADDLAKVRIKTTREIEILGFIQSSEILPTLYEAPYYAGPDGAGSMKPYALLRDVLRETGRVGIGKVVLRDREDFVVIAPSDQGLILYKLRYPSEVRAIGAVPQLAAAAGPTVTSKEMDLARLLVEQMSTSMSEIEMTDGYTAALMEIIDAKVAGREITDQDEAPKATVDIMTALVESLDRTRRKPMVKATAARTKTAAAAPKVSRKRRAS